MIEAPLFKCLRTGFKCDLLFAPTIVVTTDVEVEELWTRTVTRIPMMSPTIGLAKIELSPNIYPVVFPAATQCQ